MLTSRVFGSNGNENIFQVNNVFAQSKERPGDGIHSVTLFLNDNSSVEIFDGYVYIMNDNGKTIASYTLNNEFIEGHVE